MTIMARRKTVMDCPIPRELCIGRALPTVSSDGKLEWAAEVSIFAQTEFPLQHILDPLDEPRRVIGGHNHPPAIFPGELDLLAAVSYKDLISPPLPVPKLAEHTEKAMRGDEADVWTRGRRRRVPDAGEALERNGFGANWPANLKVMTVNAETQRSEKPDQETGEGERKRKQEEVKAPESKAKTQAESTWHSKADAHPDGKGHPSFS